MAYQKPTRALSRFELVALLAALMSLLGFSTDSLLPAMTDLASELAPTDKSRTQLLISGFMLGSGLGMVIFGPLSDSFGRRTALFAGVGLYAAAAAAAAFAGSLELLVALRILMGVGASATRAVAQSVTRDLFAGSEQARISSLIFMVFIIVPALSPLFGQQIVFLVGWRGLFVAYVIFGSLILCWYFLRQPETLLPEYRRPFRVKAVAGAFAEVLRTPVALRYVVVQIMVYGQFVAYLSSAEQLWVDAIGVGDAFPYFFALIAVGAATAGLLNARLVNRVGMRRMLQMAFASQVTFALLALVLWQSGVLADAPIAQRIVFTIWSMSLFFVNGIALGNVTALAMEPLGHVAGTAAAVIGAFGMAAAMLIAAPLGQAFDGTPRPIMLGAALCSSVALALVWTDMNRSRGS